MKKLFLIFTVIVIAITSTISVYADGFVTYSGKAREFIFKEGSEYSLTDLFSDFKDVMPGDSITQKITVKNEASKQVKVKIYIRSLGANEGSEEFLSKLNLKVKKSSNNNMAYMFDNAANESAPLDKWVYLGTLYSGGKVNLDVTLNVPVELGNDFQDQIGYLDWEFKVEELPVDKEDPKPTGDDNTNVILWSTIIIISVFLFFILIILKKREKEDKN